MNISIRSRDFEVTTAIDAFVREEIRLTLSRYADDITSIDVFLKDTNGPKGGEDKQVLMHVDLRGRRPIVLQTTGQKFYAAVKISAKRAKRAVRRDIRKARRFERRRLLSVLSVD